jgi:hypothetical protein
MRTICALVRQFQVPDIEPDFPWSTWAGSLGTASWAFNRLGNLTAISPERFSGLFALVDIQMSYGHYWVTQSLDNVEVEYGHDRDEEHGDQWNDEEGNGE